MECSAFGISFVQPGWSRRTREQSARSFDLFRRISNPDVPSDHTITKVAYRGRTFNLLHRRWNGGDDVAIQQCFAEAQYDMPSGAHGALVENLYREIVASGRQPLIIDCGANIGASVTWLSARYPEAHIVAIEPSADNFAFAPQHRGLDVDLRQAGNLLSDGHAYLENPSGAAMDFRVNSEQRGVEVDLVSIGSLLASKPGLRLRPFLLKIDIEGGEKYLFDGDTGPINQFPAHHSGTARLAFARPADLAGVLPFSRRGWQGVLHEARECRFHRHR